MAETGVPQPLHVAYTTVAAAVYDVPTYLGAFAATPSLPATWTLPPLGVPPYVLSGSLLFIVNGGTADIELVAAAGNTINGASTLTIAVGDTVQIVASNASDWTVLASAGGVVPPPTPTTGVQPVRCTPIQNLADEPWAVSVAYLAGTVTISYVGTPDFDGVEPDVGDRILLWAQDAAVENGIYTVTSTAPNLVLLRAADVLISGYGVNVAEGAQYSSAIMVLVTPAPIVTGTTPLTFWRVSGVAVGVRTEFGRGAGGGGTAFGADTIAAAGGTAVGEVAMAQASGTAVGATAQAAAQGFAGGVGSVAAVGAVAIGPDANAAASGVALGANAAATVSGGVGVGEYAGAGATALVTATGQSAGRDTIGAGSWYGVEAGRNANGASNSGFGASALFNAVGTENAAAGVLAGSGLVGSGNALLGPGAGFGLAGNANVMIGPGCGSAATTENSVAAGADAMAGATGNFGSYIGTQAGQAVTGAFGSGLGYGAGMLTSGARNIALGYNAGQSVTGSDNLHAGANLGTTAGSFQVLLGTGAVTTAATITSYYVGIGNGNVATYIGTGSGQIGRNNSAVGTSGNNLQSLWQIGVSNSATVNSDFSMQLGFSNTTGGSHIFMFGENNTTGVDAANHVQVGRGNSASGNAQSSQQFGQSNTMTGTCANSTQVGGNTMSSSTQAIQLGDINTLSNSSFTIQTGVQNSIGSVNVRTVQSGFTNTIGGGNNNPLQIGVNNSILTNTVSVLQIGSNTCKQDTTNVLQVGANSCDQEVINAMQFGNNSLSYPTTDCLQLGRNQGGYIIERCIQMGFDNVQINGADVMMIGTSNVGVGVQSVSALIGYSNTVSDNSNGIYLYGRELDVLNFSNDIYYVGGVTTFGFGVQTITGMGVYNVIEDSHREGVCIGSNTTFANVSNWSNFQVAVAIQSRVEANNNVSLGGNIQHDRVSNSCTIGWNQTASNMDSSVIVGISFGMAGTQTATNLTMVGGSSGPLYSTNGPGSNAVSVGFGNSISDTSVAVGTNSTVYKNSIVFGTSSNAFGQYNFVCGNGSSAALNTTRCTVIGMGSTINGTTTIAIGDAIITGTGTTDSILIGKSPVIGANALRNVAFGNGAVVVTGNNDSIAFGTSSVAAATSVMAFGVSARAYGSQTTTFGFESGRVTVAGAASNTAFGYRTMYNLTTGTQNCAFGNGAIYYNNTGINNTAFGSNALGTNALSTQAVAAYSNCVAVGQNALVFHSTGDFCVAVGTSCLRGSLPASISPAQNINASDTAIGNECMNFCHNSSFNTAAGRDALKHGGTPTNNTCNGFQALFCTLANITTNAPQNNCAYGFSTMMPTAGTVTLNSNCAFGALAMGGIAPGVTNNCAFGYQSLNVTLASGGCAFGYQALRLNSSGTGNSAFGTGAGAAITTGSNITAVGSGAGASATVGSGSTLVGAGADVTAGATDRIALGRAVVNTVDSSLAVGAGTTQWVVAGAGGVAAAGSAQSGMYSICPANTKSVAGNLTLAVADVGPQVLIVATTTGATDMWTLPTGANLAAKFPACPINGSYRVTIRNETANPITIGASTGITLGTGSATIAATTTVQWKMTYTATNTFVFQRVGSMTL